VKRSDSLFLPPKQEKCYEANPILSVIRTKSTTLLLNDLFCKDRLVLGEYDRAPLANAALHNLIGGPERGDKATRPAVYLHAERFAYQFDESNQLTSAVGGWPFVGFVYLAPMFEIPSKMDGGRVGGLDCW
jgi:hypothetical protein